MRATAGRKRGELDAISPRHCAASSEKLDQSIPPLFVHVRRHGGFPASILKRPCASCARSLRKDAGEGLARARSAPKDHALPPEAARRRKDRNQKRAMEAKSLRVLGRRAPQASARP